MDGCTTLEEKLKTVTGIIFNNWYSLKIALDHGQGGLVRVQNSKLNTLLDSVTSMIMSNSSDCDDISHYVSDVMDDEFDIVLEDDSHLQIVKEVFDLYNLLKSGNDVEVISKIDKLPLKTSILPYSISERVVLKEPQMEGNYSDDTSDEDTGGNEDVGGDCEMEQDDPDPGWTVVKHNRRR